MTDEYEDKVNSLFWINCEACNRANIRVCNAHIEELKAAIDMCSEHCAPCQPKRDEISALLTSIQNSRPTNPGMWGYDKGPGYSVNKRPSYAINQPSSMPDWSKADEAYTFSAIGWDKLIEESGLANATSTAADLTTSSAAANLTSTSSVTSLTYAPQANKQKEDMANGVRELLECLKDERALMETVLDNPESLRIQAEYYAMSIEEMIEHCMAVLEANGC